jgi:V8-like Glu-specific endopeptidase
MTLAAAAFALPVPAAAESTEAEGTLAPSPIGTGTQWTRAELESAEPLPIVELPGSRPGGGGARTAGIAGKSTTAFEGVEVAASEPTNLANGKVFGEFRIPLNSEEIVIKKYSCSASVVPSRRGNVILTAAHCVIDPETGTLAGSLIFVPGYHNGVGPDGTWEATHYETTKSWAEWEKRKVTPPNEGEDLTLLLLEANQEEKNGHYGENVERVVGSLGIAFDQACSQTYTQYGYPAESPYNGEILYSHVAAYAGTDTNSAILPRPVKIASDFTRGASGGPWTIGSSDAPTVLSLTAYGYEGQPGYLYGPYFGEAARKAYERASGIRVPVGIEETCNLLPEAPPSSNSSPSPPSPQPPAEPAPRVTLKVKKIRHRADGSAVLIAKVSAAGRLKLTGAAVRADTVRTKSAGRYRLIVKTKGRTNKVLRRKGRAKVGVKVAFSASGKTRRVSRSIRLTRRQAGRSTRPPAK